MWLKKNQILKPFFCDIPALIQESNVTNQSAMEPIFEEEIFTVDANGKVTMVFVTPATLCNIMAHVV